MRNRYSVFNYMQHVRISYMQYVHGENHGWRIYMIAKKTVLNLQLIYQWSSCIKYSYFLLVFQVDGPLLINNFLVKSQPRYCLLSNESSHPLPNLSEQRQILLYFIPPKKQNSPKEVNSYFLITGFVIPHYFFYLCTLFSTKRCVCNCLLFFSCENNGELKNMFHKKFKIRMRLQIRLGPKMLSIV